MKRVLRLYKKTVSIVNEKATQMYEALTKDHTGFLLESYDKNYDRYTFMGEMQKEVIRSTREGLCIYYSDGRCEEKKGNPMELLKDYYNSFEICGEEDGPFTGGLVGSLGYDFIRYAEELPDSNKDEIGVETIEMMLMDHFLVMDHVGETLSAIVLEEDTEEGKKQAEILIREMLETVREKTRENEAQPVRPGEIIKKSHTKESYADQVEQIKKYIKDGHIYQCVLSQRWTIKTEANGFDLYKKLRKLNPSPYLYYFNFGDFELIGSSPEMLMKKQGDTVYTCPIAGTRPRGKNKEEDEILKEDLLADEKERAEHAMLVDLARNDMGRISRFGTVKVTRFMEVQNYSHVMHICSMVEGKNKEKCEPVDLVTSFLPAGTLSGAPKIRAMEIIDELEDVRRGLYGGATGYMDFNGNTDFCITIRSMIKKKNLVYLQAGAGIVADSVAGKEYEECCNKVMALAKTLVKEEDL
ncbi:MAG: anthranilate synthase component I [Lachnospiraceae bacterium]|nr:anthranilate synthase component I [Lachnospiraceae bacterium]